MDQNSNNSQNLKINYHNNTGKADGRQGGRGRPEKQKGIERSGIDGKQQSRTGKNSSGPQAQPAKQNQNMPAGGSNRFRNQPRGSVHNDAAGKHTQVKRVETIEDIKADIERIDKEIQFEIKQIRSIRLGL
ncbi:MAG TPA: hypothetical protein GX501_11060 [Clostridiaceae bacterium]|nr:hypothetical protein [Clostridiaceae bacterium]